MQLRLQLPEIGASATGTVATRLWPELVSWTRRPVWAGKVACMCKCLVVRVLKVLRYMIAEEGRGWGCGHCT